MAACPVDLTTPSTSRRRPIALTQRRLEANRRNAARSTGPRTPDGKARVASNAIKHGFFTALERWTPAQQRDFAETLDGLRDDFKPQGALEESCVATIAESYVRMAAMLRYENIAALKHHQQRDRELDQGIASANAVDAVRLQARRNRLRRAGLWRPTIPGPREARAIIRYEGCLNRAIRRAASELQGLKNMRIGGTSPRSKMQKQTHYSASPNSGPEALRRAFAQRFDVPASPNSGPEALRRAFAQRFDVPASPNNHPEAAEAPRSTPTSEVKNAKTNPLTSMFPGNRHERRRARALAKRRK